MSQETELKLAVPQSQVEQLKKHPFWQKHAATAGQTLSLGNTYFDTRDRRLNQAGVALRIREINQQFTQTLKTRGESINGLTRRGEWDWPLSTNKLNGQALTPIWPAELADVSVNALEPLFTTHFQRTQWLLLWRTPYAEVEAALDLGEVRAGDHSLPICELELELLEGDESALLAIAQELTQYADVTPSDLSKAERGFLLIS